MKKIKKFRVNVREKRVLSLLKFKEGITEDEDNLQMEITSEIQEAYEYILPAAVYDTYKPKEVMHLYRESNDVISLLEKSIGVSFLAVTIGNAFDNKIQSFIENGEIAKSVIWDSVGSEAVEQSANFVTRLLKDEAGLESCVLTTRFSAGYSDWQIEKNNEILDLLEADKIGLSANQHGVLIPQKSITALIGWEKNKKKKK